MNKSLITLTILCLFAYLCSANLKPTAFTLEQIISLDSKEAIKLLSQEQDELYQKVVRDFLKTFVKDHLSVEQINRQIFEKISSTDIWTEIRRFMIEALFAKFDMNTLSESFGAEIRQFPDNYFLTFEMYDLLHD